MSFNTGYTYDTDVPNPPNDPSIDAPSMLVNTQSIQSLIIQDHVDFNTLNSGTHSHISFATPQTVPAIPLVGANQIYPMNFGAGPSYSENYISSLYTTGMQINGYLPFVKCLAKFVLQTYSGSNINLPVPANTLTANVNTTTGIVQTSATTVVVNFMTALPYPNYYVFLDYDDLNSSYFVTARTAATLTLSVNTGFIGKTVGFMVI